VWKSSEKRATTLTIEIQGNKLVFSKIKTYLFEYPHKKIKFISFDPLDPILQITL